MPASDHYAWVSAGRWRVAHLAGFWNRDLEKKVLDLVEAQPWAKHPQTLSFRFSDGGHENELFLKVFHPANRGAALKDALRSSKAFRSWRQGVALDRAGFGVPLTIAAGEWRHWRILRRAFLVTRKIDGQPAHLFLRHWADGAEAQKSRLAAKREALRRMAFLLRRFHRSGFVHGDLVASNLFVSYADGRPIFYFMDNDRTRRYPAGLPQFLWRRNLLQLNRMPLPGISLQDRVRFLKSYLESGSLAGRELRLARWLERNTRRRRHECDGVDASGDYRKLMRWSGEFSRAMDSRISR